MEKDIDQFRRTLADYINRFIVGRDDTYIIQCIADGPVRKRGHCLYLRLADCGYGSLQAGPVFYAEELMEEFGHNTAAAAAETLNARVNAWYPSMVESMAEVISKQESIMGKDLDDYGQDSLTVSARPIAADQDGDPRVIYRLDRELGLCLEMRVHICDDPADKGCGYFGPVLAENSREATEQDWERCLANTAANADIHMGYISTPMSEKGSIQVCGTVFDNRRFFDYFYLLMAEMWGSFIDGTDIGKVYIMPVDEYSADFILDSPSIRMDDGACDMRISYAGDTAKRRNPALPLYVYDVAAGKIQIYGR